jgi:carboxyl-terminal processing protease
MNREKFAWLVSIILIAMLAFQLPGTFARRDDDYNFVRTLIDIHREVSASYVDPVDEDKLAQGAIDGMLGTLDPFTVYVPPGRKDDFDRLLEGSFKGVGIQLDQAENGDIEVVTPIDDSPAYRAGVLAGDKILKVNDEDLRHVKLDDVIKKISGPIGSEVHLTLQHPDGQIIELKMTRQEVVVPTVKGFQRNADNSWNYYVVEDPKIAYIRITQFTSDTFDKLKAALQPLMRDGMKGLILDLRFNPGGRLDQAKAVVNLFVRDGVIVVTKGRNRAEEITRAKPEDALPYFPMAVLVNEHSASASEIVSGSLLDNHRALVIGTRTYGKGSVQELIPLEGGGELKMTVAYYYLPSGRLVHRKKDATDWGVEPQIVVPMDEQGEKLLVQDHYEQELFHRPLSKQTTRPTIGATEPAAPTTQAVDPQLEAAISTMIGHEILNGRAERQLAAPKTAQAPVSLPSTQPATEPADN